MLDDDTGRVGRLTLADIRPGDFLDIEALRQGAALVATRVDREEPDDDVLQGALEAFNAGDSITVFGITYSTAGAEFKSLDGLALTAEQFFAGLETGALVKVRDRAPADGIADRVKFEYAGTLDGELDFDGDEFDEVEEPEDETGEAEGPGDEAGEAEEPGDEADEAEEPGDEADEAEEPGDETGEAEEPGDEADEAEEPEQEAEEEEPGKL